MTKKLSANVSSDYILKDVPKAPEHANHKDKRRLLPSHFNAKCEYYLGPKYVVRLVGLYLDHFIV